MPELPEVETVVSELDHKLKGKTVRSVSVLRAKIVSLGPGTVSNIRRAGNSAAKLFAQKIKGQKIKSVSRRAKLLIFDFQGSYTMLVHLKMTGQFIYLKKGELNKKIRIVNKINAVPVSLPAKHTHVVFTFTDGSKLFYNDIRQFGYLKLITDEQLSHVKELLEFGPEPLNQKFTLSAFFTAVKNASHRKVAIKSLLMEPKFVAGIGNIYSDEILFRARISPSRHVRALKSAEINALYRAIRFVLKKGIAAHGSSVGDFIRTDGSFGTMGKYHFVYGRAGLPCKVCGTIIKTVKFGGRTGSFCPRCQK